MNQKRAQELLKHIVEDKDYGANMMKTISLSESIYVITDILVSCIQQATDTGKDTDAYYFAKMLEKYRPIVLEKIKRVERLWVVYCDSTGYPYELDKDILVLYDYKNHKVIEEKLAKAGFKVSFIPVDKDQFINEIGHMYRNGYKSIRFTNGKGAPFNVEREEFFSFENFFNEDYITNPALQLSMISFFQEYRKPFEMEGRAMMLKSREDAMIKNINSAEFMVPCIKVENDDEVEISHPFFDISDKVETTDGKPVIAVPIFTDGYELNKCYTDQNETMLYSFKELLTLIEELGANGVIINALGTSYYVSHDMMRKIL